MSSVMINDHWVLYMWLQVQNFIEQCLRLYMTRKEVLNILFVQEKIEPAFTELGTSIFFSFLSSSFDKLTAIFFFDLSYTLNSDVICKTGSHVMNDFVKWFTICLFLVVE